jgi:TM2 domain-containing membrane protein YozV
MAHKIPIGNTRNVSPPEQPLLFCPNCGARAVPEGDFCPMCGHREGEPVVRYMPPQQTMASSAPVQASPPIIQEVSPLPSYLQKNPRLAFLLALIPGLFTIMGLGHFYGKRTGRGVILLLIGFFPGLLAWISLSMIFTETDYEPIIYAITSMVIWALFASLLLWSAFDASKQARRFNMLPPEKLLRREGNGNEGFRKTRI